MGGRPSIGAVAGQAAGAGRSVGAAVRRPGRADAARAVVRPRQARLPRRRLRRLQARRPGHGQHEAQRHHARPARRPPHAAGQLRRACAARSTPAAPCEGMDACTAAGVRRADLEQAARGARPVARRPRRSASATATASRTSSSTTAPRRCNDQLLMARRLVEAGVRCVTLSLRPLGQPRQELRPGPRPRRQARPGPDAPWSKTWTRAACSNDVTVVAWGEFGRTPRINNGRRPRPLAAGELCLPGRRRHADRPGHRRDQPPRRVRRQPAGPLPGSRSPRSTTTSASTRRRRTINDPTGRPQHLIAMEALHELV